MRAFVCVEFAWGMWDMRGYSDACVVYCVGWLIMREMRELRDVA